MEMLESSENKNAAFRSADLPRYAPDVDHPFKMYHTAEGKLGFSYGLVRGALSYGMPAFTPTLYGQPLKAPFSGQLTTTDVQTGRWFLETSGTVPTLAAISPRNLQTFVPTAGDIKHETDVVFGDPAKQVILIGSVLPDGKIEQYLRSDLTIGDMWSVPYDGVPGVGPGNPANWPYWPDGSGTTPGYGETESNLSFGDIFGF